MSHVSPHAETAAPTRQQYAEFALCRRPATRVAGATTPVRPAAMARTSPSVTEHPTGVAAVVAGRSEHPG